MRLCGCGVRKLPMITNMNKAYISICIHNSASSTLPFLLCLIQCKASVQLDEMRIAFAICLVHWKMYSYNGIDSIHNKNSIKKSSNDERKKRVDELVLFWQFSYVFHRIESEILKWMVMCIKQKKLKIESGIVLKYRRMAKRWRTEFSFSINNNSNRLYGFPLNAIV